MSHLLFPYSIWTFISLFSLDFYFPFLFGILFPTSILFQLFFNSIVVTHLRFFQVFFFNFVIFLPWATFMLLSWNKEKIVTEAVVRGLLTMARAAAEQFSIPFNNLPCGWCLLCCWPVGLFSGLESCGWGLLQLSKWGSPLCLFDA